ncbi:MAG: CBS domain-containing protein [Candidatus Micrarchaeaceae archaeon]
MKQAFEVLPKEFVSETSYFKNNEELTSAIPKINKDIAVIVMKDKEYYGIVDDRSIYRSNQKINKKTKIGSFAVKLPTLEDQTSIDKAIYLFYISQAKALPYISNKKVLGLVKRETILKAILSLHLTSKLRVRDIMSSPVIAVTPSSSVLNAKAFMQKNKINRLVVTSNGKTDGILTYRDILNNTMRSPDKPAKGSKEDSIKKMSVESIYSQNPFTINYNERVDDALRIMLENNISSILVNRSNKTVGVLTTKDILEALVKNSGLIKDNIIIFGLDYYTKEYESEIREEIEKMYDKLEKFHKINIVQISLNVKRHKSKNYELHMRVWLGKRGIISHGLTGFSLEETLSELIKNIYDTIKKKKEIIYMKKESLGRYNDED